ncbi:MAG: CerR family C-terminal domain-containing protein [Planctomycetes bacterium]|nr:CerR family C-terminal domain-containing protein [Planctomycetota bacterium]
MSTERPPATSYDTRQRILDAASEIFAKEGFARATVRDICQRAGANIAAVNYHFGDKEKLYGEVLLHTYQAMVERHPVAGGVRPEATVDERFAGFVRAFCRRVYSAGPEAYLSWLMAREMVEPSPVLDQVVNTLVRPQQQHLVAILKEMLGPNVPDEVLRSTMGCVIGQILFFHHCRPVVERLFPDRQGRNPDPDRLAEVIVTFSLPGLRAVRAKYARGGEGR